MGGGLGYGAMGMGGGLLGGTLRLRLGVRDVADVNFAQACSLGTQWEADSVVVGSMVGWEAVEEWAAEQEKLYSTCRRILLFNSWTTSRF
mgnify:FL=1